MRGVRSLPNCPLVAPSRVILGVVLLDPLLAVKVARISLARTQLHRRMKASALFSVFASYSHKQGQTSNVRPGFPG